MTISRLMPKVHLFALAVVLAVGVMSFQHTGQASAACATALPTDKGTVTQSITVPATGSYRVWSRVLVPSTTANSFYMQIDSTLCSTVIGGSSSIPANTWTWVDYQSGTTTNKVNVSLGTGAHTLTMAGKDDGVEVDRVILTTDTTCTPTGTGDNCANPPDTTPPTVNITSPTTGSTLTGTTTTITAAASDDTAVSKVEFYVDGTLRSSDSSSPYTYALTNSSLTPGTHSIYAKAYDAANNITNSSTISVIAADTTAPTATLTAPTTGSTVSGTISITGTATDNVGVTSVTVHIDNTDVATDSTSPYSFNYDTTALANGSHTIILKAFDAAGNVGQSSTATVTINNVTTPPPDTTGPTVNVTAPANGSSVNGIVSVTASAADSSGVKQVQFYVDNSSKSTDTTAPYSYSLDTTALANGSHTIKAVATDSSTNANTTTSSTVTFTVNNVTFLPEDINQDGHVNILDFSLLASKFGSTGSGIGRADINADGTVNILDFSRLASKFGT